MAGGLTAAAALAQDSTSALAGFEARVEDDTVTVWEPADDDPIEYQFIDESTDTRAFFTLVRQDDTEEEILFSYDQEIDEVAVTAENTELQVTIIDDKKIVAIDDAGECPWEDYECIRDAVNERLVDFEDQDLVAIVATVNARFDDMEDAYHVSNVMELVAERLAENQRN